MKKPTIVIQSETNSTLTITAKGVSVSGGVNFTINHDALTLAQLTDKLNLLRTLRVTCDDSVKGVLASQLVRSKVELKPGVPVTLTADLPEPKPVNTGPRPLICLVMDPDLLDEMIFLPNQAIAML